MGQTVYTDTVCDRCHHLERTDDALDEHELPVGWVLLETTPFAKSPKATVQFEAGAVTEYIICPICNGELLDWIQQAKNLGERKETV